MQASPYSLYNEAYKEQLEYIYLKCGLKGPTQIPASVLPDQEDTSLDCGTDEWYTTSGAKETLPLIQLQHRHNYQCWDEIVIEYNRTNQLQLGRVQLYNPWVGFDCVDLQAFTFVYGTVLCFGSQFGQHNSSSNGIDTTTLRVQDPYTYDKITPPKGAKIPKGTTERCGGWHVAEKADSCARICAAVGIHIDLLFEVNTDLGDAQKCPDNLAVSNAYCAAY
ncbi:LysM domain protein [Fusarium austroafricanum]|uniref:LysM domain protein n=1 Tax=Fusarium austroafricanum TaxID=2364996 RepID=A0A8H4KDX4_9HYPO|nr:LysM domain protein [Fusarium austroafricanum]